MFGPLAPGFSHFPAPNPYRYSGEIRPGATGGQAAARALEEEILRRGRESVAARGYPGSPGRDEPWARRLADSLIGRGLTAEGWTPDVAAPQPLTPR